MKEPVKILQIDKDYQVLLFLVGAGVFIKSIVPLESALTMLKNDQFDLILSEPHHKALLTPQSTIKK
jgi:hypothetical protein